MSVDQTYLTGKLLLATPVMGDPRFHKAVIFVVSHSAEGAMGLIINFPLMNLTVDDLLQQTGVVVKEPKVHEMETLSGGPLESGRGFLLHTSDFAQQDTTQINAHFSLSGTLDALKAVAEGTGPKEYLFILGYAGWAPGQLEQELRENAWLVGEADHNILFNTPLEERWDRAYSRLGVDPSLLSDQVGRA